MREKNLKRILTYPVAILMIATIFMSGCNSTSNSKQPEGQQSAEIISETEQEKELSANSDQNDSSKVLSDQQTTGQQSPGTMSETGSSVSSSPNQGKSSANAMTMLAKPGAGINIGNDLDVKDVRTHIENPTIEQFETFWGNVPVTKEVFELVKSEGFSTVRIPVSWSEHMDASHKVDSDWMKRVHEVVDMALDSGLYVIIDTHHETFVTPTYDKENESKEILTALWQQIAAEFSDYDERLLFEGLNEPRLEGTQYEWTEGTDEARQVVNKLNRAFVDTVRKAGGNNEKRYLIISGYGTSCHPTALSAIEVPEDDDYIMVAIHIYSPYNFVSNTGGTSTWSDSKDSEIKELGNTIENLFTSKDIPVVITEFGCMKKSDDAERIKWLNSYMETFAKRDIPCIWWDNGVQHEYMIIDRSNATTSCNEVIDTLTSHYN